MFSEKKDKKERRTMEPSASQNRINEGTQLVGDIQSSGFFRIDGSIEGNISNPSKVVLGKSGIIKGKLECDDADIEGTFEGKLHVKGILSIKSTAVIEGEIIAGKLAVEPGASINATCAMQGNKKKGNLDSENSTSPYDRQQRTKKSTTSEVNKA